MPDLVSFIAGVFTVLGPLAIALCWSANRINAADYTQCRGLDRLHK
jgi:hypothetical protein